MVNVPNKAKKKELAKFYAETVSKVVSGVTPEDYIAFTKFLEKTDKPVKITPIHFIVYLTGVTISEARTLYLEKCPLKQLIQKRTH
ncbi:hypothetical protein [Lactococcus taiwanensis]|uniref:hypothetical protein n=1 Tax=Lactococcus taiwanensis TaxID=1151742 RepID=UPI003515A6BD